MKKIFLILCLLSLTLPSFAYDKTIKKTTYEPDKKILSLYDNPVVFNTNTYKYHKPYCEWSKKCTVNCVYIEKQEAKQKGIRCKVCGG